MWLVVEVGIKSLIVTVIFMLIVNCTIGFLVGFYVFYMSLMILLNLLPRFFDKWSLFMENKTTKQRTKKYL